MTSYAHAVVTAVRVTEAVGSAGMFADGAEIDGARPWWAAERTDATGRRESTFVRKLDKGTA